MKPAFCINCVLIAAVLLTLFSCGGSREEIQPRYRFTLNQSEQYRFKGSFRVTADGGLIKYNGNITMTADLTLTPVETNGTVYKILVDIRNPEITGADSTASSQIYLFLNQIRTWLATITIQENGKVAVYYGDQPHPGLTSYVQLLFPDFSTPWQEESRFVTNFPATLQNRPLTIVFKKNSIGKSSATNLISIDNDVQFITYNRDEYEKSVEPNPVGNATMLFRDIFNYKTGKLESKKGSVQALMTVPLGQGFLTFNLSVSGSGEFEIIRLNEPAS